MRFRSTSLLVNTVCVFCGFFIEAVLFCCFKWRLFQREITVQPLSMFQINMIIAWSISLQLYCLLKTLKKLTAMADYLRGQSAAWSTSNTSRPDSMDICPKTVGSNISSVGVAVHLLQSLQKPSPCCGFMLVFHVQPHKERTNKANTWWRVHASMQRKDVKGSKSTTTGNTCQIP